MDKVGNIIKSKAHRNPVFLRQYKAECDSQKFGELFLQSATNKLYFKDETFVVDGFNKDVINQLFFYLSNSVLFDGDHRKGILMAGALGCGKTVIMEAFMDVFNATANKVVASIDAKGIAKVVAEKPHGYWHKRPLFIDDIGKEETDVISYGNKSKPFEDLIEHKYRTCGLTFGTTNLKLEDMPYNQHILDRMKEVFNIVVLPGKTRRR